MIEYENLTSVFILYSCSSLFLDQKMMKCSFQ